MKRIIVLALAMAFVIGGVSAAQADGVDVKVTGYWDFAFGWVDGLSKSTAANAKSDNDNWIARQRVRIQTNFIVSEQLQGVFMVEVGTSNWGEPNRGADLNADDTDIEVKRSYIDWVIPQTDIAVRMGVQGVSLPMATGFGNPVMNADVAGIVAETPINDMVSLTAFWLRPFDGNGHDSDSPDLNDEVDMFGLVLPVKGDGWSFTPWAAYAAVGSQSGLIEYMFSKDGSDGNSPYSSNNPHGDSTDIWYAGAAFELTMFDPLTFAMDIMYGTMGEVEYAGEFGAPVNGDPNMVDMDNLKTSGWLLDARLDYALSWATPGIFGWYGSGDDADDVKDNEFGRMPIFGADGGTFAPTSFGFSGSFFDGDTYVNGSGMGTWGIGVQLADVSFIEDLSHTLRVAYYRGTNDHEVVQDGSAPLMYSSDGMYLTDKDSVIEVNFDHQYKIYENLTAVLELGYLHLDADEDTWNPDGNENWNGPSGEDNSANAWKAQVSFRYEF